MQLGVNEEEYKKETGIQTDVMSFGKHKDEKFEDIPFSYLHWAYSNLDLNGWLKDAIENEYESRLGEKDLCYGTYSATSEAPGAECDACELIDYCKDLEGYTEEPERIHMPWDLDDEEPHDYNEGSKTD